MKTFYDLMLEAQQGALAGLMAKEFGIAPDQQAKAFEALMPAFWLGFRQRAADPFGIASLWQSMAGGQHKSYFDNPFAAMSPAALAEGNNLLERLFGSKEMAQAVALQVEAVTGIAQDVVRRMMPVMANMMAGGIERHTEQVQNPFLGMMSGMGQGLMGQAGLGPAGMGQGGTGKAGAGKSDGGNGMPDLPFMAMMQAFLGQPAEPKPQPTSNADVIDRMFDAGRSMQNQYAKSMEAIFDQFKQGAKKS